MTPTSARLLAQPGFRRWFLARSVSLAGTSATAVAMPLLVYATSGSAGLTAAVAGLEAVPYLLFGLVFGALADRLPRRRMMLQADILAAVLLISVPATGLTGDLTETQVLVVAFGLGVCFCWFDAAAWGALPRLVGPSSLARANSLGQASSVVLSVAAPAAAGLLIARAGPPAVLAADAATYLLAALLLRGIRTPLDPPATTHSPRRVGPDVAEGLRFIWREPVVRSLTLAGFGLSMAGGGALALLVVHADRALGIGPGDGRIGLLYAADAVGALVATGLLPGAQRMLGDGRVSLAGYGLFALATLALAVVARPWLGLAVWAVWELAYTLAIVNAITVRQRLTPDHLQGRVNTTGRMIAWGGTPFGTLFSGAIAQWLDVRLAYAALAVPVVLVLVALACSPVRALWLPRPGDPTVVDDDAVGQANR